MPHTQELTAQATWTERETYSIERGIMCAWD